MSDGVDHRLDLRLAAVFATVVGGGSAAFVTWALSVRGRLPDPVARHWGAGGTADGFSSLDAVIVLAVGLPLLVAVPLGLAAVIGRQPVALRRSLAGLAVGLPTFVLVLVADSLRVQLDLADPAAAPVPGLGIGLGALLGVVAGGVAAAVVRHDPRGARASGRPPDSAVRLDDPTGELRWVGRSATSRPLVAILLVTVAAFVAAAAAVSWWLLAVGALVAVGAAGAMRFAVIVDGKGVVVRAGPLRLLRVGVEDVAEAGTVDVDPFWEFGGWGLRVDLEGRVGFVSRKGEALRVVRGDGSEVIITVDDAVTAAATLNTAADRRSRGG